MADELNQGRAHGYPLDYDDNGYNGMKYLKNDLDNSEARVFFDQARRRGYAEFEDDNDRQYTMSYKNGKYTVTRR
ncbi:MAG: hypothetical protein A3A94_03245 [Candidatus Portnoybacteria bacterium RIFCSPLOWO2_01_FULL_43_11]|uniref:Uncharacterized protein n=3 Tax=Bacteria candidate phyla TaxID=1783234 RepID=A0A1G2FID7_9BACT|nr:MAG: hypothetical protein A2713_02320 [candidate division WWE3 bacterium RIFCSPHIGHO2_01_FULL_35_17]OGZ37552.1 MAG: hypothetical protein A3E90_00255 [Candidatus Portnoybacteria bacterium RIFCSPHIGHO2_12_FULL_40_11]OGZ38907.1 MAG: hypothetical protein A3A94_03245 [Candidatus Portnoybacteria bacterium RIFCSPLOWO2_01_FULL_43_11]